MAYNDDILAIPNNLHFYPFNETSGTVSEDLQNNDDGLYVGTVLLNQSGPCVDSEGGVNFTGVADSYMETSHGLNVNDLDNMTLEVWINPDVLPPPATVFGYCIAEISERSTSTINASIRLFYDLTGKILVVIGSPVSQVSVTSINTVPLGQWSHIAITRTGSGLSNFTDSVGIFINGVDEGVTVSGGHQELGGFSTMFLAVGAVLFIAPPADANFFDGRLAKVAFYNRILSAAELLANNESCLLGIDFFVGLTADDATPREGDIVTFTVTLQNNDGALNATNINITIPIPSGLQYISLSIAGGDTQNDTDPITGLVWTDALLGPTVSAQLTFQARVNQGTSGNTIQVNAEKSLDEPDSDLTTDDLIEILTIFAEGCEIVIVNAPAIQKNFTRVDLANQALILLGLKPINDFENSGPKGQTFDIMYPHVKCRVLMSSPWRFTLFKAQLSRETEPPVAHWKFQYALPGDRLAGPRALYPTSEENERPTKNWETYGDKIFTNHDEMWIDYQRDVPEFAFPIYFSTLMTYALAATCAESLTDDTSKAERWQRVAFGSPGLEGQGGYFAEARKRDSQQHPSPRLENFDLIDARFAGIQTSR